MDAPGELDDAAVARAVAGDADTLEALLRVDGPRLAGRLSIDPRWQPSLDPEDVLQVTYLEVYLRIRALRKPTREGFRAWVARIAENNLRDALRALARVKRPEAHGRATNESGSAAITLISGLIGTSATAGSIVAGQEAVARLHEALERLPASYRRVVQALDLEERPVGEVAGELSKSTGAVHMLRSRAHDRLRELLGAPFRFFGDSA